jgi:hypothetical protein
MVLTNAEKQARWRERHIGKRREAQRIVNLLVRKTLTDQHVNQVASLLSALLGRRRVSVLRRALKPSPPKEMDAIHRGNAKLFRDQWLREHPGRTVTEYNRLLGNHDSEVWDWRRAKGRAAIEAEARAFERDHPGQEYPEHQCGLNDREATDLERWRRKRDRQARKLTATPAR